jgi:hypothetical protein
MYLRGMQLSLIRAGSTGSDFTFKSVLGVNDKAVGLSFHAKTNGELPCHFGSYHADQIKFLECAWEPILAS